MADFAKELNDALAEVVTTRKTLSEKQAAVTEAAEKHQAALNKAIGLRDKMNSQVNEALLSVGIEKADSRVSQSS